MAVWCLIATISKLFVIVLTLYYSRELEFIGYGLLAPVKEWPQVTLVIVLVIAPVIVNAICFWV